jgi:hypothetical protein
MARSDNAVGLTQVTGAAAAIRERWPQDDGSYAGVTAISHLGTVPALNFAHVSYAGGVEVTSIFAGANSDGFQSTVAAGNGVGVFWGGRAAWFTELTGGPLVNECACWSLRATIAYDPFGAQSFLDQGIVVLAGNNNSMFANGTNKAGIQFGATNTAEVRFRAIAVQGGAVTVNSIVNAAVTPLTGLYNTYEIRIISGSNSLLPQAFGVLNGQIVTPRFSFGVAAGLLPGPAAEGGGFTGYTLGVLNISNANVPTMHVQELVVTAAQSERDLF